MNGHTLLLAILTAAIKRAEAFTFLPSCSSCESTTTFSRTQRLPLELFSASPRQPRRMLKKRRKRQRVGNQIVAQGSDPFPWDTAEIRPLIKSEMIEAGEDYWIDEKDLEAERQRILGVKNRKAMEGEVPKEKLWSEVKAPYKQNWIGYFSVMIAILSVIIIQFPELLEQPTIQIPDL